MISGKTPLMTMHENLVAGKTTSLALVLAAFARIAEMDKSGPTLNAVLEINPQAEQIARAMDAEISAGKIRGPLHGIPILVKDNIDTADMMHTSAGALALQDRYAPRDAHIVTRLREAGAVLLGKTNMTELANAMTDHMPNGYSSRGGQVKSRYGEAHDPSGSSTGSAVAVSAGYVPVSIGTETLGSIISPAGEAGVVGIKPTVGLASRQGIIPISISQDTAGPMGRSVLDCAIVLDIISGVDQDDPVTLHGQPTRNFAEAVRSLPESLQGIKLGIYTNEKSEDYRANPAFSAAVDMVKRLGAETISVELPAFPGHEVNVIFRNEFRQCMDYALRGSEGSPKTLSEIAQYNLRNPQACLRYGQTGIDRALRPGAGTHAAEYLEARGALYAGTIRALEHLFEDGGLTAILTPACSLFAVAGFPSITIPIGMENGKPVPLVINGPAFSEVPLVRLAAAVERAIGFGK